MEAEICDLLDRKLISLYGFNNPLGDLSRAEVTGASEKVKDVRPKKKQAATTLIMDGGVAKNEL